MRCPLPCPPRPMKPMLTRSLAGVLPPAPSAEPATTYGKATVDAAAFRNSLRDCVAGVPPALRRRDAFDTALRVVLIGSTIVNSILFNLMNPLGNQRRYCSPRRAGRKSQIASTKSETNSKSKIPMAQTPAQVGTLYVIASAAKQSTMHRIEIASSLRSSQGHILGFEYWCLFRTSNFVGGSGKRSLGPQSRFIAIGNPLRSLPMVPRIRQTIGKGFGSPSA